MNKMATVKKKFGLGVGIFSVCVRERVFKGDIGFVVLEYYTHTHTHTHARARQVVSHSMLTLPGHRVVRLG